jgi:hypothetical protein
MASIGIMGVSIEIFDEKGRIETSTADERNIVLNIFSCHYNMHPLIPDHNGIYQSAEAIHRECINEIYIYGVELKITSNCGRIYLLIGIN